MICNDCFTENYVDHIHECKTFIDERIPDFLKKYQAVLRSFKEKVLALDEQVTSFMNFEMQLCSGKFLELVSSLKKFDIFNKLLHEEEEHK